MTGVFDQILAAIIIALVSGMIGKLIGERGKVSKLQCDERQAGCMKIVCIELEHIKEELADIKKHMAIR